MQDEGGGCGFVALVLIGIGVWFVIGDPQRTAAGWFYPDSSAPWETVDAFYYPNKNDLTLHESALNLDDVQACRSWAYDRSAFHGDPTMMRSEYECGVGEPKSWNGLNVYRITVD